MREVDPALMNKAQISNSIRSLRRDEYEWTLQEASERWGINVNTLQAIEYREQMGPKLKRKLLSILLSHSLNKSAPLVHEGQVIKEEE